MMKLERNTELPDVVSVISDVFKDNRGSFLEIYHAKRYNEYDLLPTNFVQDNVSFSNRGVIRGLHYQIQKPQGKLVWVAHGSIFDVAVDIRRGSPTFGKWLGITLSSDEPQRQLYIPTGFAHGFYVLSDSAVVMYKCTDFYAPSLERGLLWNDPAIGIKWPGDNPTLSDKDAKHPTLNEMAENDLPIFESTK